MAIPDVNGEEDYEEDDHHHHQEEENQRKRKAIDDDFNAFIDSEIITPGVSSANGSDSLNQQSHRSGSSNSLEADRASTALSTHVDHSTSRLSDEYIKTLCLDVYKELIGNGLPSTQKNKMDRLMGQSLSNTNIISGTVKKKKLLHDIEVPDLALLYALQSVCFQRIGQHELSKQLYQRSRQTVSTVFDNITDFNVVCSYAYLSNYLVGEGDFLGAKFYLNSVLFYLEQQKHNTTEADAGFLKKLTTLIHLAMEEDKAQCCFLLNRLLSFIIQQTPELNIESNENGYIVCEEELSEKLKKLDLVTESLTATCQDNMCASKKDLNKVIYLIQIDTMRIKILEKHGLKDSLQIRQAADRITDLTKVPSFELAPVIVVRSLSIAARVHYNFLVKDVASYQDEALVRNLTDDLKALKMLGKRYDVVKTRFQQLIRDIELVLEQAELYKMQRNTSLPQSQVDPNDVFSMINSNPNFYTPYLQYPNQDLFSLMFNPATEQQTNPGQFGTASTPLYDDMFIPAYDGIAAIQEQVNLGNTAQQSNLDSFMESLNGLFQ